MTLVKGRVFFVSLRRLAAAAYRGFHGWRPRKEGRRNTILLLAARQGANKR
jgi:hypothetical protein